MSQNTKKEEFNNVGGTGGTDFDKQIEKKEMTLERLKTEIAKLRTENVELKAKVKEKRKILNKAKV